MFTRKGYSTSLFIILALSILTLYCSSASNVLKKNKSVSVVGTVGSEIIEFNDLMQGYMSGGINQDPSAAELKDFLPIYLNYRAKLLAASEAGYFENKTILDEYAMYENKQRTPIG